MIFTHLLPLLACVTAALAKPMPVKGPLKLTGRFDAVHDPSVVQKPDGSYLLVSTSPQGMEIRTSKDKLDWKYEGNIFPGTPPAGVGAFNNNTNDLWAPDIHRKGDVYHLRWSASSFGSQDSGIFYATSKTGMPGSFEQKGLIFSSKKGDPYNSIDPAYIKDGSHEYMAFGSFWSGLYAVELNRKTGKVLDGAEPVHLAQRDISVEGAVEGPSIIKKGKDWWLFMSWDKCCSATKSTYNTRAARSTTGPLGPYFDKDGVPALEGGGTLLLASEGEVIGPGGGVVHKDTKDGSYYLYHHWYSDTTSSLGIRKLDFSSGWPVVV